MFSFESLRHLLELGRPLWRPKDKWNAIFYQFFFSAVFLSIFDQNPVTASRFTWNAGSGLNESGSTAIIGLHLSTVSCLLCACSVITIFHLVKFGVTNRIYELLFSQETPFQLRLQVFLDFPFLVNLKWKGYRGLILCFILRYILYISLTFTSSWAEHWS